MFGIRHLTEALTMVSRWMRPHVVVIGMAAVATLLVVYGETINRFVKKRIRSLPWLMRLVIFMALCAFGYASVAVFLGRALGRVLAQLNNIWLAPIVVLVFLAIGFIAEREGHV
ncbi:MAG: DUF3392 family protein [Chitinivibrionales bacterium]|nr:DUF3392 family protein [Chitinivibrionales bacterium]